MVDESSKAPKWFPIAGFAAGLLTLVFFMYMAVFQNGEANAASIVVLALGAALSFSFIGGKAAAEGKIPIFKDSPVAFTVAGGAAVFVIMLLLGWFLFVKDQTPNPRNSEYVEMTFGSQRELIGVIQDLESVKDITVTFAKSCPAAFPQTLVSSGTHRGKDSKDFLENLRERLRDPNVKYVVNATGRQYEIVCN